ncbi:MAG: helix-turn-helix domain-containing protein [Turicibacter sp.]
MSNHTVPHLNGFHINFELLTQKLKEIAHEKGMTQAQLAEGITPRDHLNKILNGKRNPSLELLYQLCNKLHVDMKVLIEQCYFKNYEETTEIFHEMKKCVTRGNYDGLEELVNQYADYEDFQFGIGKQFYLHQKGAILLKKYHKYEEALEMLHAALDIFTPEDATVFKTTKIYTVDDMAINTYIAICLFHLNKRDEAIKLIENSIYNRLSVYESQETRLQLRAFYYLAYFQFEMGNYEKALEVATEGILRGRCKFIYIYLGDLNVIKGKCYYHLGNNESASYHFKRALEFFQLFGLERFTVILQDYLKEINFDIDFTVITVTRPNV